MDLLALADFNLVARHEGFGRAPERRPAPRRRCRDASRSSRRPWGCGCSSAADGPSSSLRKVSFFIDVPLRFYPSRRLLSARVAAFLDQLKRAFPTSAPEELAAFSGD